MNSMSNEKSYPRTGADPRPASSRTGASHVNLGIQGTAGDYLMKTQQLFGANILDHKTPSNNIASGNSRPLSAGRLGNKVRSSINQAAKLKP